MTPRRRTRTAPPPALGGLTLDAGALIALERRVRGVTILVRDALMTGEVRVPLGALGQVWRDGSSQAVLAALLRHPGSRTVPIDETTAKAAGVLCGRTGTKDVVDASVAICALLHGDRILTSDPGDLTRLAPGVRVVDVSTMGS